MCQLERDLWMDEYREFHKANRGAPGARYLVYFCGPGQGFCAGTGDRVRGMLYLLRVAAVHNMVFLAKWEHPANLTLFLEPSEIDWRPDGLPEDVLASIGKEHNQFTEDEFFRLAQYGDHNLMARWETTHVHTTTAWPASFVDHRIWGTPNLWPQDSSGYMELLGPLGGVPAEYESDWLAQFTFYIDISACWWNFTFKPSANVEARARVSLEAAYGLQPDQRLPAYVGWHWRTGGQRGETNIVRQESQEFFRPRLQQVMAGINCARALVLEHAVFAPLLLVTDLNPFRKWVRSGAMGTAVATLPSYAQHVDMRNGELAAYVDVLAEALVLSRAKCVLISQSGFSNTALMMRTEPLCFQHIDVCMRQQEPFFDDIEVSRR